MHGSVVEISRLSNSWWTILTRCLGPVLIPLVVTMDFTGNHNSYTN